MLAARCNVSVPNHRSFTGDAGRRNTESGHRAMVHDEDVDAANEEVSKSRRGNRVPVHSAEYWNPCVMSSSSLGGSVAATSSTLYLVLVVVMRNGSERQDMVMSRRETAIRHSEV